MTVIQQALRPPMAVLLTTLVSAVLLASAHGFQHIGGLSPCELCLEQRTPHWVVLGLGGAAGLMLWRGWRGALRLALIAMALALFTTAGIGLFHVGVEQHWWQGPTTCSAAVQSGASVEDLLAQLQSAALVSCDQVPWSLFGISMAGYNFLISAAAGVFAFVAGVKARRHHG
ncbi:MAG: disulfide bond formation protein B [Pseudomonadota bacterium]